MNEAVEYVNQVQAETEKADEILYQNCLDILSHIDGTAELEKPKTLRVGPLRIFCVLSDE